MNPINKNIIQRILKLITTLMTDLKGAYLYF